MVGRRRRVRALLGAHRARGVGGGEGACDARGDLAVHDLAVFADDVDAEFLCA
jgi:hypothetical protein